MNEALVLIGVGVASEDLPPISPHKTILTAESLANQAADLKSCLKGWQLNFKSRGIDHVRYIILIRAGQEGGLSLPELLQFITAWHREITHLTAEMEIFVLLPSLSDDQAAEARCHRFFAALEASPWSAVPEGIWLLDPDRMPANFPGLLLTRYLTADVYRSLNNQQVSQERADRKRAYRSLGLAYLFFPARSCHRHCELRLALDLLNHKVFQPLPIDLDSVRLSLSHLLTFLETNLGELRQNLLQPLKLPQTEILFAGLLDDETEELKKLLVRLKLLLNQAQAEQWEKLLPLANLFTGKVKEEVEATLDQHPHGLYAAWGFLGLLLGVGGPYYDYLTHLQDWPAELGAGSLPGYFFGWQGKHPAPPLNMVFAEVNQELREFYAARFLPFPEPTTWQGLLEELDRLLILPELEKVLQPAGLLFIEELRTLVGMVVESARHPYAEGLSVPDLEKFLELLERQDRIFLEQAIEATRPFKKRLQDLETVIASLGWKQIVPYYWVYYIMKWSAGKKYREALARLELAYEKVVERRQRLFPCYLAPYVAQQLEALIKPRKQQLLHFIAAVDSQRRHWETELQDLDLSTPPGGLPVLEKAEDLEAFYYHELKSQEIPALFKTLLIILSQNGEKVPGLSFFYAAEVRHQLLFTGIAAFCLAKFAWLQDYDVTAAVNHLHKGKALAPRLEKKAAPPVEVKEESDSWLHAALFVGLPREDRRPFNSSDFSLSPLFYTHKDPVAIVALRLNYGLSASSLAGWDHWAKCAAAEVPEEAGEGGNESHGEDPPNPKDRDQS